MNRRLVTALAAFAILGVAAGFTLRGKMLAVVLLVLAWFAFRSVIADRMRAQQDARRFEEDQSARSEAAPSQGTPSQIGAPDEDSRSGMERA